MAVHKAPEQVLNCLHTAHVGVGGCVPVLALFEDGLAFGGRGLAPVLRRDRAHCRRPALSGARHDMGAAREHGILNALADPATSKRRRLSANQKAVNAAHAPLRGPANAQLTSWKILREIRSSPTHVTLLLNAVQTLTHAS